MIICVDCKVVMSCKMNGMGARFNNDHVYLGDLFLCSNCKKEVIVTNQIPVHDSENKIKTIKMKETKK